MRKSGSFFKFLVQTAAVYIGIGLAALIPMRCDDKDNCSDGSKTYYGPAPCETDQQCIEEYGENWYCDTENVIDEACNVVWPACKENQ